MKARSVRGPISDTVECARDLDIDINFTIVSCDLSRRQLRILKSLLAASVKRDLAAFFAATGRTVAINGKPYRGGADESTNRA